MDSNAEYRYIARVPRTYSQHSIQHHLKSTIRWASPSLSHEIRSTLSTLRIFKHSRKRHNPWQTRRHSPYQIF